MSRLRGVDRSRGLTRGMCLFLAGRSPPPVGHLTSGEGTQLALPLPMHRIEHLSENALALEDTQPFPRIGGACSAEEAAFLRALEEAMNEAASSEPQRTDDDTTLRPFEASLAAFREACPAEREVYEQSRVHGQKAYACDDLETWPESPPTPSLHLHTADGLRLFRVEDAVATPLATIRRCWFNAIGTWSCRAQGSSVGGDGWRIVVATLVNGEGEDRTRDIHVIFAVWRVKEGDACAVAQVHQREAVAQMVGLTDWPSDGWEPFAAQVWR